MSRSSAIEQIRLHIETLSAVDVADLFLSPSINAALLVEATREPGPSLWIVNRSDVENGTLEALSQHALPDIAARAREKIRLRQSKIYPQAPAPVEESLQSIDDNSVEDILGHPLVPFEAVLFYARALNEDIRASAALSLTRRLLEFPPDWFSTDPLRMELSEASRQWVLNDPSPYVRSYAARIPLLTESTLHELIETERHPYVLGKSLQNSAITNAHLEQALGRWQTSAHPALEGNTTYPLRVLALDSRLSQAQRATLDQLMSSDPLTTSINNWYLSFNGAL